MRRYISSVTGEKGKIGKEFFGQCFVERIFCWVVFDSLLEGGIEHEC
jgi:hypothetical protein